MNTNFSPHLSETDLWIESEPAQTGISRAIHFWKKIHTFYNPLNKHLFSNFYTCGVAVQSERKPFDVQREKPTNCAASTEKIYIRKDLRSPLIATPTFVADKDGAR